MAKAEASVEELVSMIERGELRLPQMQRQYCRRSTRIRDLLDPLYRGYPVRAILLWETDENDGLGIGIPSTRPGTRFLLVGHSASLALRMEVRRCDRARPKTAIELSFNLDHPDHLTVVTEVNEEGGDDEEEKEALGDSDSHEDELQKRLKDGLLPKKLERFPESIEVSEISRPTVTPRS